jgi:hypothetical protein
MTSYLMSQLGQWRIITTNKDRPLYQGSALRAARKAVGLPADPPADEEEEDTTTKGKGTTSMTAVAKVDDEEDNLDEIRKWDNLNNQAMGNIRLRLHYSIQHKYHTVTTAGELWEKLAAEYNQPGIMTMYLDFKAVMDITIPENTDPSLTIDKITALFGKLWDNGVKVPDNVQAMILMAKMPWYMDSVAQLLGQEDLAKINIAGLRKHIVLAWEQQQGHAPRRQNQAQKISAVQRSPNEPTLSNSNEVTGLDAEDADVVEMGERIRDLKHSLLMRNQLNNSRFSSRCRQVPRRVQHHHNHSSLLVASLPQLSSQKPLVSTRPSTGL